MPIAAEDRHRYPVNWTSEIVPSILARAQLRCECLGECGRGHEGIRCPELHLHRSKWGGLRHRIHLTIAHLDHTPETTDPRLLRAMCQGCHLHYDRDHHDQSRIRRWRIDAERNGLTSLFEAAGENGPFPPAVVVPDDDGTWAVPEIDPRELGEQLRALSLKVLPIEVLAGLESAAALLAAHEAAEPFVLATVASAIDDARAHGAQANHLADLVGHTLPWLRRLRARAWREGWARGADTPRALDTQERGGTDARS